MKKNRKNVHRKHLILLLSSLVITACLFTAGCTDTIAQEQETNPAETIVFGTPNWPGVTVKTHVVKNILESNGYDVEIMSIADPGLIYTAMAERGDVDVLLGGWLPATQKPYWDKYGDKLELVNINVNETWLGLGVPGYVYDAGIHSIPDLKGNAEKFDGRIVTLEAGNGMTIAAEKSIEAYGLDGFEVQISSTPAMLAEVQRAEGRGDWIVFCAWEPHYMMLDYDIKKLEDPQAFFGNNDDVVYTVTRKDFKDDFPWVYEFLKNFQVSPDVQSVWIGDFSANDDPDDVAKEWIQNNPDLVESWMPETA